jgi:hypothetical protein
MLTSYMIYIIYYIFIKNKIIIYIAPKFMSIFFFIESI